jgi:hypothetical protein
MATVEAYQLTPTEFSAVTDHAWSEETCPKCQDLLQHIQQDEKGNSFIYPTGAQAEHMAELFGYEATPYGATTGYLDPEDPKWQKSVEHIQERLKSPKPVGTFGPQAGMRRGEPTRDEWQITSYLDSVGVEYVHKMKLEDIDPTEIGKPKAEYDIYIPHYLIAIETSPGWHIEGRSAGSFPEVTENDLYKIDFAKNHGIDLITFDPNEGTEKFINNELVPRLQAVGIDAYTVSEPKEPKEPKTEGVTSEHEWNQPLGGAPAYQEQPPEKDFKVYPKGSIIMVEPLSPQARAWVKENVSPEGYQPYFPALIVEAAYIEDLVAGIQAEGMSVEVLEKGVPASAIDIPEGFEGEHQEQLDQSQNIPRFPERGKVNDTIQDFSGQKSYQADNWAFAEEGGKYFGTCRKCGKKIDLEPAIRMKSDSIQCPSCGAITFINEDAFPLALQEEDKIGEIVEKPSEWKYRLTDPKQYDDFRRGENQFGEGIDVIFGFKGKDRKSEIQAIRFSKEKFKTQEDVETWLADNTETVEKLLKQEEGRWDFTEPDNGDEPYMPAGWKKLPCGCYGDDDGCYIAKSGCKIHDISQGAKPPSSDDLRPISERKLLLSDDDLETIEREADAGCEFCRKAANMVAKEDVDLDDPKWAETGIEPDPWSIDFALLAKDAKLAEHLNTLLYGTEPIVEKGDIERIFWCGDCGSLYEKKPELNKHIGDTGHKTPMEGTVEKYEDHFNSGFAQVAEIGDFSTHKTNTTQGKGSESPMQTDYGYQEQDFKFHCPIDGILMDDPFGHFNADHPNVTPEERNRLIDNAYYKEMPMNYISEAERESLKEDQTDKGNPYAKTGLIYRHVGEET